MGKASRRVVHCFVAILILTVSAGISFDAISFDSQARRQARLQSISSHLSFSSRSLHTGAGEVAVAAQALESLRAQQQPNLICLATPALRVCLAYRVVGWQGL